MNNKIWSITTLGQPLARGASLNALVGVNGESEDEK